MSLWELTICQAGQSRTTLNVEIVTSGYYFTVHVFENPRLPRLSEKGGMNNVASRPWIHCSFFYPETGV